MRNFLRNILLTSAAVCVGVSALTPFVGSTAANAAETTETPAAYEDFVVGKADTYSEDVWADALSIPLEATKGEKTGEADVKLVLIGTQLYFRMTAEDATKLEHDTPTFEIAVGDVSFKWDRSSYLKVDQVEGEVLNWPRETPNESHTYMNIKYTEGAYVWTAAYDLTERNALDGAHVKVTFRHCDLTTLPEQWQDNDDQYTNILAYTGVVYLNNYSENDPVEPGDPEPEYPADPEPEPGEENPDYKIVITDLPKLPKANDSDWADIPKYEMIAKNGNSSGATGTVQVVTCDGNIIFRVEIHDDTISWNRDGRKLQFGNEEMYYSSQGNYDTSQQATGWWAIEHNDFTQPVLGVCELRLEEGTDKTGDQTDEAHPYGNSAKGTYVYYIGYQIRDKGYDITPGNTIDAYITHSDSQHKGHVWNSDSAFHTIYFDQTMTFGEPADTTVRPDEPTEGFTGSASELAYNKATISWGAFDGAESYAVMLYRVNPEGSKEPYEFIKMTEGYVGEETLSLGSLSEKTKYVVQILALDEDGATIGASGLVSFETPSQNDPSGGGNGQGGTDMPDDPAKPQDNSDKTGLIVGLSIGGAVVVAAVVVTVVLVMRKKKN